MNTPLIVRALGRIILLASVAGSVMSPLHAQAPVKPLPQLPQAVLRKIEAAIPPAATVAAKQPRRVLVFWRCEGFVHGDGIAAANQALALMGHKTGAYTTELSADYSVFEPANLAKYDRMRSTSSRRRTRGRTGACW